MKTEQLSDLDRLAVRERPEGQPIMHQDWGKLLFMHWRVEESALRPLVPKELEIDTFDGSAWIGIVPFTMWGIRALPPYLPPVPGFSSLHELNVRTYVYYKNVPGVWFFSLDANSAAAVFAARALYFLHYFNAEIEIEQKGGAITYSLNRTDSPAAEFRARWKIGDPMSFAQPGTLDFFLVERYCLYSARNKKLYRARVHHQPYPLRRAETTSFRSTMIESHGIPTPQGDPLLHYVEEVNVDIWPLEEVMSAE
jgi:hypothetical protein